MRKRLLWLPTLLWATAWGSMLLVPTASIAQEDGSDLQTFFEAVEVNIVNVDVIAIDNNGDPVTDLEVEDFEIFEDGERVEVTNFFRPGEEAAVLTATLQGAEIEGGVPETADAAAAETPLTMAVFVDNASLVPGTRKGVLDNLKGFLEAELRANDRMILLTYDGKVSVVQQPTSSIDQLIATLDAIAEESAQGVLRTASYRNVLREVTADTGVSGGGGGGFGTFNQDATAAIAENALSSIRIYAEETYANTLRTLAALREALGMLSALPGPKALVYAGSGITQRPSDSLVDLWEQRFGGLAGLSVQFQRIREIEEFDASDAVDDVAQVANTHRITMYTVNPPDAIPGLTPAEIQGLDASGNRTLTAQMGSAEITNRAAAMNLLSGATGGRSTTGAMDDLLDTVRRDFDSMYSLAYSPHSSDKKKRRIKVEVARPGVKLRYRHHYRETSNDERLADRTRSALMLTEAENPMGVIVEFGAATEAEDGLASVPVMVKVPMSSLTLLPQGTAHEGRIALFIAARDDRGRLAPVTKQTLPLRIPNADLYNALSQVGGYTFTLKLRPLAHTVAVTVHDEIGRVESVAQADFGEPDFS